LPTQVGHIENISSLFPRGYLNVVRRLPKGSEFL
jgi:hypothetical protein